MEGERMKVSMLGIEVQWNRGKDRSWNKRKNGKQEAVVNRQY